MEYNVEGSIFIYDILQGVYNKEYIKFKLHNVCSFLTVRSIPTNCRIVAKILLT
jgi:hypothetical protein